MTLQSFRRVAVARALCAGLLATFTPTVQGATPVTIKKIGTKTAPYAKTVVIKPAYGAASYVQVHSAQLTVKKGKKTVKKNVTSVNLKAGKYKVTQNVKYRTFSNVSVKETVAKSGDYLYPEVAVAQGTPFVDTCRYVSVTESAFSMACIAKMDNGSTLVDLGSFTVPGTYLETGVGAFSVSIDGLEVPVGTQMPVVDGYFDVLNVYTTGIKATKDLTRTVNQRKYSAYKATSKTQKLTIKQGKKPGQTVPISEWNCPSWAPIKGNESSMIYHKKGQRFYSRTKPEACFSSESAAKKAGYRKSKV
ncbi:MAG: hypothetical protein E6Q27_02790 [Aeromicrobium sp.]|nr:MAG: hypothetical protein E6Q27_02790 [Aeromicrobium sp.]